MESRVDLSKAIPFSTLSLGADIEAGDPHSLMTWIQNYVVNISKQIEDALAGTQESAKKLLDYAESVKDPSLKIRLANEADTQRENVVRNATDLLENTFSEYLGIEPEGKGLDELLKAEIAFIHVQEIYYPLHFFALEKKDSFKFLVIDGLTGKVDPETTELLSREPDLQIKVFGGDELNELVWGE